MSAEFRKSGDKGCILLEGDLTLPYAEDMKKAFQQISKPIGSGPAA